MFMNVNGMDEVAEFIIGIILPSGDQFRKVHEFYVKVNCITTGQEQ